MVVLTSSLSAIPCPCRTAEKNSTRGWLGCSSELRHKSGWTFLNICCGWLAPWLAEFDQREREPLCLGVVGILHALLILEGGFSIFIVSLLPFLEREGRPNYFWNRFIICKHVTGHVLHWRGRLGMLSRSHLVNPLVSWKMDSEMQAVVPFRRWIG